MKKLQSKLRITHASSKMFIEFFSEMKNPTRQKNSFEDGMSLSPWSHRKYFASFDEIASGWTQTITSESSSAFIHESLAALNCASHETKAGKSSSAWQKFSKQTDVCGEIRRGKWATREQWKLFHWRLDAAPCIEWFHDDDRLLFLSPKQRLADAERKIGYRVFSCSIEARRVTSSCGSASFLLLSSPFNCLVCEIDGL